MMSGKMARANEVLLYKYRTTGMTMLQMIQQARANLVEARTLAQRRDLVHNLSQAETQLENFLAMLRKKSPNVREEYPTRIEHDMVRLLLDRLDKFLVDEVVYLKGNYQTSRAERAETLLASIMEAKAILLTPERPTTPVRR